MCGNLSGGFRARVVVFLKARMARGKVLESLVLSVIPEFGTWRQQKFKVILNNFVNSRSA